MARRFELLTLLFVVFLSGCGSSGSGGGTPTNINISGKMTSSSTLARSAWDADYLVSRADGDPLVGYQLFCVTFAASPVSAKATTGSDGSVTLTLAASGVAFGCFVLDASGNQVATLTFKGTSTTGGAASFTGDAVLGTIQVNAQTGFAQATITSDTNVVKKTPSGVACPLGTYTVDLGLGFSQCNSLGTELMGNMIVSQDSAGYRAAITAYPGLLSGGEGGGTVVCGHFSSMAQTQSISFTNNTLTFAFPDNTNCPAKTKTITAAMASDCSTASVHIVSHGCSSCASTGPGVGKCNGCGSTDCDSGTYTATRQ